MRDEARDLAEYYDEHYFLHGGCGLPCHRDNPHWHEFFGGIADAIVAELAPRTVLDAGCGIGFLVEALRDRGVDAWGIDISEYAIGQVREDVQPYCSVASITDELDRDYDLIVCIEVVEHLPRRDGEHSIANLARHADTILFSSTPDDFREPSHFNVQPTDYWVSLFARHGFYRDVDFDASFIADHAICFRRTREPPVSVVRRYERWHWRALKENRELRAARLESEHERGELLTEIDRLRPLAESAERVQHELASARAEFEHELASARAEYEARFGELENQLREERARHERERDDQAARLRELERENEVLLERAEAAAAGDAEWRALGARAGWRIYVALAALRLRLAPLGTRRDRVVRFVLRALASGLERLSGGSRTASPGIHAPATAAVPVPAVSPAVAGRPVLSLNEQYRAWLRLHALDDAEAGRIRLEGRSLAYRPRVSIVMPVFNTEPEWLAAAIESVRGQLYEEWEVCIADDGSTRQETLDLLRKYENADERIKITFCEQNQGISAASNAALALAQGEFVGLLDHDDELRPEALFEVVKLLNDRRDLDLIYSDEDKKELDGTFVDAFFKPDWSPDLLLSANYITHFSVFRKEIVDRVGGFRVGFEGSQDYDLILRVTEATDKLAHIPKPLYTWRKIPGSAAGSVEAKPYARDAAKKALRDAVRRRGLRADVLSGAFPGSYRIKYAVDRTWKVAIIIPTRDRVEMLRRCIESIRERTWFTNYEILVVDNDSREPETLEYLSSFGGRVVECPGDFNFSRLLNTAARETDCHALLFLNNDTEVVSEDWIEAMLEHGQRPEVAAVGARLLYPDGRPQHEGVVVGLGGAAGHVNHNGYFGLGECVRNWSAVTAACMLTPKSVFDDLGGFDERFPVAFNDVDYCLRARNKDYLIVYTPHAVLFHHEGATRGRVHPIRDEELFYARWGPRYTYVDPYYNPNLTLQHAPFNIRTEERG